MSRDSWVFGPLGWVRFLGRRKSVSTCITAIIYVYPELRKSERGKEKGVKSESVNTAGSVLPGRLPSGSSISNNEVKTSVRVLVTRAKVTGGGDCRMLFCLNPRKMLPELLFDIKPLAGL
jgi:hypothetical protein